MDPVSTAVITTVTRFTSGDFSEMIQKDVGGEAVLYAAKHDIHGKVMVKVFIYRNKYSEQEVRTLVKVICHQNIVRILGSFYCEDRTDAMRSGYVMEFMANGCLSAVIHDLSIKYNDNQVYSWIQQAGRGIAYLHSQNINHRDVNTRNMLLGETIDILKISDFGSAKLNARTTMRNSCFMGTIVYMAPEVIDGQGVNSAADVYSLGISTWEMFHRKKPFYEHDSLSLISFYNLIITGTRPKIEFRMEEEMKNLILGSLQAQSKLRPKASDFTTIAVKLGSETSVSLNAPKAQKALLVESKSSPATNDSNARQSFAKKPDLLVSDTSPSRLLSSVIQKSFDTKLTLLIGGYRDNFKGHETILAFEHNTKTWKQLDVRIPDDVLSGILTSSCFVDGAVVLDEELYVFGEEKMVARLFKLNPENRSWIELTHIPNGRRCFQSIAYRSKIYVVVHAYTIGSLSHDDTILVYDPVANSWSKLAPIKYIKKVEGLAVFNNKLYIFGRDWNYQMEAGYYDTLKDEWTYLSLDVPSLFVKTLAVTYKSGLVFFDKSVLYVLNLDKRKPWKILPGLKPWRDGAAVFTCGNSLFVAGGHKRMSANYQCSDRVEGFDGKTWTEMPCMPYELKDSTPVTATGDLAKQLLLWSR